MDQYFRGQPPTEMNESPVKIKRDPGIISKEKGLPGVLFQPCIFSETFVVSFRGDVSVVYWSVFGKEICKKTTCW